MDEGDELTSLMIRKRVPSYMTETVCAFGVDTNSLPTRAIGPEELVLLIATAPRPLTLRVVALVFVKLGLIFITTPSTSLSDVTLGRVMACTLAEPVVDET